MSAVHPPKWAKALVRRLTPREDRDFLIEDLDERFSAIVAHEGRSRARRWYARQALRAILSFPPHAAEALLGGVRGDLLLSVRVLRRRPLYTIGVVGTMALGLASAATVGMIAWAVWLSPFPFPDPDRVVRLYEVDLAAAADSETGELPKSRLSPPLLEDLRAHDWTSVQLVAGVSQNVFDWQRDGSISRVRSATVSPEAFDILGLRIVQGRGLTQDTDAEEIVLSETFWERAFGSDPSVVGSASMTLNGTDRRIVGVARMPSGYPGDADLLVPIRWGEEQLQTGMRGARFLDVIALVQPGFTTADAAAEMDRFVRSLGSVHGNHQGWGGTAATLSAELLAPYRSILSLLLLAGTLFLLLALANVAGLVAARSVQERRERAVRLALGSSQGRLMRTHALESLIVGAGAAVVALVGVVLISAPLRGLVPPGTPRADDITVSLPIVAAIVAVALFGGLVVGGVGYLLGRGGGALDRAAAVSAPGSRGRGAIVVSQVAVTTLLGIGGVAVLSRMASLQAVDLGFEPTGVAMTQLILSGERHPTPDARRTFWQELIARGEARGLRLAIATNAPLSGMNMPWGYYPDPTADQAFAQYHIVNGRYFETMGVEILEGRGFTSDDHAGGALVVIVNERFEEENFPNGSAVGREIVVVGQTKRIVGVAANVLHAGPDRGAPSEIYAPYEQDPWPHAHVLAAGEPSELGPVLGALISELDPALEPPAVTPYRQYVSQWFSALRLQSLVVALLAGVGTLLAALGLYALVAYRVRARRREIGIRMALGASDVRTFARVVYRGTLLSVVGTTVGAGLWFMSAPRLATVIEPLGGSAPWMPLAVGVGVIAVSALAAAIPANQSVSVDPASTLRAEG